MDRVPGHGPRAELAIVIPAYKPDFLARTLESVAAQTDQRFSLYLGDDAGPEGVRRICEAHRSTLGAFTYHRFVENLGAVSLASHWNRCVALTKEPWVWLFSDDDLMLPDCVAAFHEAHADAKEVDVLRFQSEVVDAEGRHVSSNPRHPAIESGADFVFERLLGRRAGYAVDYVFRRSAFDAAGGFPEYPLAWGSDYAAWFLFSRRGGIRTLAHGGVQYRQSERSISGSHGAEREKFDATLRFLRFVEEEVAGADPRRRTREEWRAATENWFLGQVKYLVPVDWSLWWSILRTSGHWWSRSSMLRLLQLAGWNAHAWARRAFGASPGSGLSANLS